MADFDPVVQKNLKFLKENPTNATATIEPNAFMDSDFFGWGFMNKRPPTAYYKYDLEPDGDLLTHLKDYEEHRPNAKSVLIAMRASAESEATSYSVFLFPQNTLEIGLQRFFASTKYLSHHNLILARKYNAAESAFLTEIFNAALIYREFLKSQKPDQKNQIRELLKMRLVDLPINFENSGLVRPETYVFGKGIPGYAHLQTLKTPDVLGVEKFFVVADLDKKGPALWVVSKDAENFSFAKLSAKFLESRTIINLRADVDDYHLRWDGGGLLLKEKITLTREEIEAKKAQIFMLN